MNTTTPSEKWKEFEEKEKEEQDKDLLRVAYRVGYTGASVEGASLYLNKFLEDEYD